MTYLICMKTRREKQLMSKHFTDREFACKCCGELPEGGINPVLVEKLETLRALIADFVGYECPVFINSAYRCPAHNAEVGGVPDSQHVLGNASDIDAGVLTVNELGDLAVKAGFDGIGRYYNAHFVHVDVRDNGNSPNYYTWVG